MLQNSLQRPTRSRNFKPKATVNTTTISADFYSDDGFQVPLSAFILLGFLAACLVAIFFIYLGLRHYERKLMEKIGGRGHLGSEDQETALLSDHEKRISDGEEQIISIPDKTYTYRHDEFYRPLPLRAAVLVVSVAFSPSVGRLSAEIIRLESFAKEIIQSGIAPYVKLHTRLQPLPDQFRYRTSSKPISRAVFNERFAFDGFRKRDLEKCWFRFRLYSHKLVGRDRMLGQVNVSVMEFQVDNIWTTLTLGLAPSEEVHRLMKKH